ncbi:hypothetical protein [Rhizobium anhuiense]|uniref:hypothetical protein n=1 Tax=Rhizobium anhuiense TaxID=1184720 RepID=UPI001FCE9792|nr:hypothetical protein [Rhizobium anhuiense]
MLKQLREPDLPVQFKYRTRDRSERALLPRDFPIFMQMKPLTPLRWPHHQSFDKEI